MKLVSQIALGAALAFCSASFVATTPAVAQKEKKKDPKLSKEERSTLAPLQAAVQARDVAAFNAALGPAQAAAKGTDAKYLVGRFMYEMGEATANRPLQNQGIDTVIASGGASGTELAAFLSRQANLAYETNDLRRAESALTQLSQVAPDDAFAVIMLGNVRNKQNRIPEGLALFDKGIGMLKAQGKPVPTELYKAALNNARVAKLLPQSMKAARDLIAVESSPANWRDAIQAYRQLGNLDKVHEIDALRLQRAAGALHGERDYYALAERLSNSGYPGEAKAVLDEGVANKMVTAADPESTRLRASVTGRAATDKASLAASEKTALAAATGTQALKTGDAYLGYGNYDKAAALYRAALQKGSVDANLVNTHLGIALGLGGQRAEAEAAFKAVTGPRAELANLWLLWLSKRA